MGVIARPLPLRPMPWRLIALVALIGLLAVASLVYVGAQRRVPPPFGLAANGSLVIGTADGDIVSVDPITGKTTPLITGPTVDGGPYFSPDGLRFVFDRRTSAESTLSALWIANSDGSNAHELVPPGPELAWFDWDPFNDRALLITKMTDGEGRVSIVDPVDHTATDLPFDLNVVSATWRPNHDQLIVSTNDLVSTNGVITRHFWVVNADGSGAPRPIPVSKYAINDPRLSPDGTKLAYATWEPSPGPIRIVDIDKGGDRPLTTNEFQTYLWQDPSFSPDGTKVLVHQFIQNTNPPVGQLAVIDVIDGSVTTMGPTTENPQPDMGFSPDGAKILATYPTTSTTWMFDATSGRGQVVPFAAINGATWQRRAP
jgi:Tol biopolymer transport system component